MEIRLGKESRRFLPPECTLLLPPLPTLKYAQRQIGHYPAPKPPASRTEASGEGAHVVSIQANLVSILRSAGVRQLYLYVRVGLRPSVRPYSFGCACDFQDKRFFSSVLEDCYRESDWRTSAQWNCSGEFEWCRGTPISFLFFFFSDNSSFFPETVTTMASPGISRCHMHCRGREASTWRMSCGNGFIETQDR